MRKELKEAEVIEKYLLNEMNDTERTEFEEKMNSSLVLTDKVEAQKTVIEAIELKSLKESTKTAHRSYRMRKFLAKGLIIIVIGGIIGLAVFLNGISAIDQRESYASSFINDDLKTEANSVLDVQSFLIKKDRDTVVETQDGLIIYVPANAFATNVEQVNLTIQSAINGEDIMLAGLSTMSDTSILETGGMFYVDAYVGEERVDLVKALRVRVPTDKKLSGMMHYQGQKMDNGDINWINPKPIEKDLVPVDIMSLNFYPPNYEDSLKGWGYHDKDFKDSLYYSFAFDTEETYLKSGEALFKANCTSCHKVDRLFIGPPLKGAMARWEENSSLDNMMAWVVNSQDYTRRSGDPYAKQLLRDYNGSVMGPQALSENEIELLFEYVEGFKLPNRSLTLEEARFIYGPDFSKPIANQMTFKEAKFLFDKGWLVQGRGGADTLGVEYLSLSLDSITDEVVEYIKNGINPASIKTIWDRSFNKTILATKAFEERMPYIHESCNQKVLELYINNLNLGLSEIDEMAAELLTGELKAHFLTFANRGDGKVRIDNRAKEALSNYYSEKMFFHTEAIKKMKNDFWNEQKELNEIHGRKLKENNKLDKENRRTVFEKEYQKNLCKVYEELNYPYDCENLTPPLADDYYELPVENLGWHNIDRKVNMATAVRTSKTFSYNGKTSNLTYNEWTGIVENYDVYDRIYVYNLPQSFNSYVKIGTSGKGTFKYRLNVDLEYETLVLAWKGDQFFFHQSKTTKGPERIKLKVISKAKFKSKLSKRNINNNGVLKALEFIEFEQEDQKRIKKNFERQLLKIKVEPVIFPCRSTKEMIFEEE